MAVNVTVRRRRIENDYSSVKTVYAASGGLVIHRELAVLYGGTDIVDRIVQIPFGREFSSRPIGWFKVYRMRERDGEWVESLIAVKHATQDWLTTTGFEFIIPDSQSLTGLVLEYYYTI